LTQRKIKKVMLDNMIPPTNKNVPPSITDTLSVNKARLPIKYEAAKQILAECSRIDECQDWADKAEALASYARQAKDDSLRKCADRIQARAIRRASELLSQFDARPDNAKKQTDGSDHLISRYEAGKEALYRKMGEGCFAHARELARFKSQREATA